MIGAFVLTSLISCNDSESEMSEVGAESRDEVTDEFTLDELISKIQEEQQGETVMPESRLIFKMEYYDAGEHLILYFQRNPEKAYLYKNVPKKVWENFKSAKSKGRFFGEKVSNVESYKVIR